MITTSRCTFTSPRGHQLSARIDRPADGRIRGTAVFAHCFTCGKDLHVERRIAQSLTTQGFAVLAFDFTGLGRSGGDLADTTFTADVADLVAAAAHLEEAIAPPTLLVGHSLGGAAVLCATPRIPSVKAVATIGAPADPAHVEDLLADSIDDIATHGRGTATIAGRSFTIGRSFIDDLRDQDVTSLMADLDAALLLLHAPSDQVVGVDNARILYDAARHPKSFVSLDTADHLLTDERDARYAAEVIGAWAERYLPPAPDPITHGDYGTPGATATTPPEGLATHVASRGFDLMADEPGSMGGTESGPTPYDYLAAGLASCTSLTLQMYARRKGYPLRTATAAVTFERVHAEDCADCASPSARLEVFHRRLTLTGDLTGEQRDDLMRIADRCPVHKTLHGHIEVRTVLADAVPAETAHAESSRAQPPG